MEACAVCTKLLQQTKHFTLSQCWEAIDATMRVAEEGGGEYDDPMELELTRCVFHTVGKIKDFWVRNRTFISKVE